MQRRLNILKNLKIAVSSGSITAIDASHRALQMLEATPQPVRLQEPKLEQVSHELLTQARMEQTKSNVKSLNVLKGRLQRLQNEDRRLQFQLSASSSSVDTHKPRNREKLHDIALFTTLYTLFDQHKYTQAFEQLTTVPTSAWKRAPHTTQLHILKTATEVLAAQRLPKSHVLSAIGTDYLKYIDVLVEAHVLPPNWITQPTSCSGMKAASIYAKDPSCLLELVQAQNRAFRESNTLSYALAQRDLTEPHVLAPPPHVLVTAMDVAARLGFYTHLPHLYRDHAGPMSKDISVALIRHLVIYVVVQSLNILFYKTAVDFVVHVHMCRWIQRHERTA
jgi:hypothetical protein